MNLQPRPSFFFVRRARESAKNALEAFVYATREKLGGSESAEYEAATGEEERDALREGMGAAEDWLYEDGELSSWFIFSSPSVRGFGMG